MKAFKKIASFALALTTLGGSAALASCGGGGNSGSTSANIVDLYYWASGSGTKHIDAIIKEFNKSQDKYTVKAEYDANSTTIMNSLDLGKSNNYDLYFTILNTTRYDKNFLDLTELLDSNPTGEEVTIRSKFHESILNGMQEADGSYKMLSNSGGFYGIVYNKKMIPDNKLPRTTDELNILTAELAGELSGSKKPWIFWNEPGSNAYLNNVVLTWAAQYDGNDYYYNNLLALKDPETGVSPSKEVLKKKDGRYKALKVLEQVLTPDTAHGLCSNTNFTTVQTNFVNGEAAMMVNGSWIVGETKPAKGVELGMMKMPVISSIVETLEDTEMDDTTLSEIVKAVDNGETSSELCSENDFKRIKTARNTMYNNACEHYAFIPSHSPAKDGALEFLKFYYSDTALNLFMQNTCSTPSVKFTDPSKLEISKLSDWNKTQFEFCSSMTYLTDKKTKSDAYVEKMLNPIGNLAFGQQLINKNAKDRKSADQLWKMLETRVEELWNAKK